MSRYLATPLTIVVVVLVAACGGPTPTLEVEVAERASPSAELYPVVEAVDGDTIKIMRDA